MGANFTVKDGKITTFDKFIVVFNFNGLNEVLNQGFSFSKRKISKTKEVVGVWKIKPKNQKK